MKYLTKLKKIYSTQSIKIAGVVGTGIHLYSTAINNKHFQDIYEDFANERYISGTLKSTVPFILPYVVSFYAAKKAKKETQKRMNELEFKIKDMEKTQKNDDKTH